MTDKTDLDWIIKQLDAPDKAARSRYRGIEAIKYVANRLRTKIAEQPAASVDVDWVGFLKEWIGDGCLGSFEHREKFRKAARALIDSAGGAKGVDCRHCGGTGLIDESDDGQGTVCMDCAYNPGCCDTHDAPLRLPVVASMSETLARRIRASLGQFDDADRDVQTLVRQLATDYAALLAEVEVLRADAARLDYIERTFSGMTNRERYLPVQMIWGKGCNGRTLREACDKYMARDAAMAGANTEAKPSREAGSG